MKDKNLTPSITTEKLEQFKTEIAEFVFKDCSSSELIDDLIDGLQSFVEHVGEAIGMQEDDRRFYYIVSRFLQITIKASLKDE